MQRFIICLIFLFNCFPVIAEVDSVKVVALFSGKAMLVLNGKNIIMKKGEEVEGVTLLSASGRGAIIRFEDGTEKELKLNQSIQQGGYKKPEHSKLTVYANNQGMFKLGGKINGHPVQFLVDTGATDVAISSIEADALRLSYRSARKGIVQTASEQVPVWHIKLDNITVGGISVSNVDAVVLKGSSPDPILLGMSFLRNLRLKRNGAEMILEQKY